MNATPVSELKIIVTGGSSGIGAAACTLLANEGAHVMIADINDEQGAALARDLGDKVVYHHLDVASQDDWQAAIKQAEATFGGLNALFNNAAIPTLGKIQDCSPEEFRKTIDVNLYGAFLGIHLIAPALARAGGGAIVNTSSIAGLWGTASLAAYVASKFGVSGLTRAAALDLAGDKIRVYSVNPGPIRTSATAGIPEEITAGQPIPRFGEPEEVARMVRFLICEATYSTGSDFVIDGGRLAGDPPIDFGN